MMSTSIGSCGEGRYKISSSKELNSSATSSSNSSRHTSPVIIELGTSSIKVGIAGEAQPRCIFPSTSIVRSKAFTNGLNTYACSYSSFITTPPLPNSSRLTNGEGMASASKSDEQEDQFTCTYMFYHQQLSPFFHNLFTYRLHLKPKSRRVLILMPLYYPPSYRESIQSILLDELKIPAIKFVDASGLYTTVPYALGKNVGLVVDFGLVECQMGIFFNRDVLKDSITISPVGKQTLIQQLCNDLKPIYACNKDSAGSEQHDNDVNNIMKDVVTIIEDILMNNQSALHRGSYIKNNNDSSKHIDMRQGNVSYKDVNKFTQEYIQDFYFNVDNPHSLIHTFLTCLLKCPIDLRLDVVRNICFIGDGVSFVPNLEHRFLSSIQALFEKDGNVKNVEGTNDHRLLGRYKVKNTRHQKFQSLAMILMQKGPLSLIYPLPYDPSCISWVGGSVYGSLNISNDRWIHMIDNTQ